MSPLLGERGRGIEPRAPVPFALCQDEQLQSIPRACVRAAPPVPRHARSRSTPSGSHARVCVTFRVHPPTPVGCNSHTWPVALEKICTRDTHAYACYLRSHNCNPVPWGHVLERSVWTAFRSVRWTRGCGVTSPDARHL